MRNDSRIVYHGSSVPVTLPEVRTNGFAKDFGFYCTDFERQAQRWALSKRPGHVVSVWGSVRRAGSLKFFAGEGFRTHAACYYDKDIEGGLRAWAEICRATDGCVGLMYTSWRSDLSLLPVFAEVTAAGK